MAALVITPAKIAGIRDFNDGPYKVRIRDVTIDTGDYAAAGNTITAASLGLKTIDFVGFGSGGMTGGTAGATMNGIGIRYASNRQSVIFQQYESAASGSPSGEKGAEATVANATIRLMFWSCA